MNNNNRPALWTKDFILVFIANLLLFFAFYMLIPVLPQYLLEKMDTSGSVAGIVLALYTISALLIRPFSGFLVDMFSRKPLYLICYGFFCFIFAGYVVAGTLVLFILMRILHGLAFGMSTVSGSTVAVDIMTSERRGEGIGYYGMASSIAMATGPVFGLWIHGHYSYDALFLTAFLSSFIGLICIFLIKPIKKMKLEADAKQPISLDRFVLVKALPCVALLFLTGVGYGAVLNYVGLFSDMVDYKADAGVFFIILSIGIFLTRIFSSKLINKGKIVMLTKLGSIFLLLAFILFAICSNSITYYLTAFLLGIGYGYINPVFQTMFINLAEHNQRGTANATYFTFWDMGIGIGTVIGGVVIEKLNFGWLYAICSVAILLGIIYFSIYSASYYQKNKLR